MMHLVAEINKAGSKTVWSVWIANNRLIVTKGSSTSKFWELEDAPKYVQRFMAEQNIDTLRDKHVEVTI